MNVHVSEFGIQLDNDLVLVTTSRNVAERFGKNHLHVLRDIEEIIAKINQSKIGLVSLFRRTSYRDEKGEQRPSYIIPRTGFMLLVMGYTGIDAFLIKLAYAQAFDTMEAQLRGQWKEGVHWREALERLDFRLSGLAVVCEKISDDTGEARRMSRNSRREISPKTKAQHIDAIGRLGGRCPCCGRVEIVKDGNKLLGLSEFDHYRSNQVADLTATWLICFDCHRDITDGKLLRDETDPFFTAYQAHRRNLPKRQFEMSFFADQPRKNPERSKQP